MEVSEIVRNFALAITKHGSLAEWLGTGLQNRLQQFDSARNLKRKTRAIGSCFSFVKSSSGCLP